MATVKFPPYLATGTAEADGNVISIGGMKNVIAIIEKLSDRNTKRSWQCSRKKTENYQVRRLHPLGTMDVYKMSGDVSGPQWSTRTSGLLTWVKWSLKSEQHACLSILQERHKLQTGGPLNLDPSQVELL